MDGMDVSIVKVLVIVCSMIVMVQVDGTIASVEMEEITGVIVGRVSLM